MNRRILLIDDNQAIHEDFRKILCPAGPSGDDLSRTEMALFGEPVRAEAAAESFELASAYQGEEGAAMVSQAVQADRPYALAFVDIRMPPGWDGVQTINRMWQEDLAIQTVICTAYSDYTWGQMIAELGASDRLLILKKPFDGVEVRQLAEALTAKWQLARWAAQKLDELEQTVRQRTHQVEQQNARLQETLNRLQTAHAQLLQADKMASIGQLAAGVAHEINNPIGFVSSNLNSLSHYVDALKRVLGAHHALLDECLRQGGNVSARAAEAQALGQEVDINYLQTDIGALIAESIEGTQRVRQIVADLRDFSHVDNPDVTDEDLNRLLDKTINVAWNELKYKTEVVREYGQLPPIRCYGGKLGQVFLNLLVNAAQAIEQRGTLTVRTSQAGENVRVEIVDTGCGIPPENLNRLFEPFFTTKDVGKGTGMGLHLAYKIVEAHQGHMAVESKVGEGTAFRVTLPIAGPPGVQEEQHESVARP